MAHELHESGEDYLEAILMIENERGLARSVDVAERLGVTKASVSKAMGVLEGRGYIEMARRQVRLTEAGRAVAERMLERHEYFRGLLVRAGVTPEVAAAEACHMEHCLSSDSFAKLRAHLEGIDARCATRPS